METEAGFPEPSLSHAWQAGLYTEGLLKPVPTLWELRLPLPLFQMRKLRKDKLIYARTQKPDSKPHVCYPL